MKDAALVGMQNCSKRNYPNSKGWSMCKNRTTRVTKVHDKVAWHQLPLIARVCVFCFSWGDWMNNSFKVHSSVGSVTDIAVYHSRELLDAFYLALAAAFLFYFTSNYYFN